MKYFLMFIFASSAVFAAAPKALYDIKVKTIEGKNVALSDYSGKVLLIVNTASQCGYTPQLQDLEELYKKYKKQGFEVLAFPSNDFRQDSGTSQESQKFAQEKYQITFPMFDKGHVRGSDKQDTYAYLVSKSPRNSFLLGDEVAWNFEKFIVDRKGEVVGRFGSSTKPTEKPVVDLIEKSLNTK